jgi:hypothetical protein
MVTSTETCVICNKQLNKHIDIGITTETCVICNKQLNKIATPSHMSPATIERGVMCVCYPCDILISVKVSPLLCFQN